jgi:phosphoadenosine phosphosulfate reductase
VSDRQLPPIPADIDSYCALDVVRLAVATLGNARLAVATSFSAEDMVVLDLLHELGARPRVFTVDTGRLPRATLVTMDDARHHFGVEVEIFRPDLSRVRRLTRERGANLFYRSVDDRRLCCDVRRVEPLERALKGSAGWITGLRRGQAPSRSATLKIGLDDAHGQMWKVAPLADWTATQVWDYIADHALPYNRLYDQGYASIGCDPCTRAVAAGADPRSGRWWWEEGGVRECGMHLPAGRN